MQLQLQLRLLVLCIALIKGDVRSSYLTGERRRKRLDEMRFISASLSTCTTDNGLEAQHRRKWDRASRRGSAGGRWEGIDYHAVSKFIEVSINLRWAGYPGNKAHQSGDSRDGRRAVRGQVFLVRIDSRLGLKEKAGRSKMQWLVRPFPAPAAGQ